MFIQSSPISVLFGFVFGWIILRTHGEDVSAKLRKSFEPMFMNFFLPFIIIDGAVNAIPKVNALPLSFSRQDHLILEILLQVHCAGAPLCSAWNTYCHSLNRNHDVGPELHRCIFLGNFSLDAKPFSFVDSFIYSSLISATDTTAVLSVFKEVKISGLYLLAYPASTALFSANRCSTTSSATPASRPSWGCRT